MKFYIFRDIKPFQCLQQTIITDVCIKTCCMYIVAYVYMFTCKIIDVYIVIKLCLSCSTPHLGPGVIDSRL